MNRNLHPSEYPSNPPPQPLPAPSLQEHRSLWMRPGRWLGWDKAAYHDKTVETLRYKLLLTSRQIAVVVRLIKDMFKEAGINRSAVSCNLNLLLKQITAPPAWLFSRPASCGPGICAGITRIVIIVLCSVLSLRCFAVSRTRLLSTLLFFSSLQTGFCCPLHNAGTFLCNVKIWVIAIYCFFLLFFCYGRFVNQQIV